MSQRRNYNENYIKYVELNDVTKAVYQNPWNTAETILRWKFIALNEYITKEEI